MPNNQYIQRSNFFINESKTYKTRPYRIPIIVNVCIFTISIQKKQNKKKNLLVRTRNLEFVWIKSH